MRLSIEDIPEEGLSLELTKESLTIEGDVASSEFSLASPLKARLDIHRGGSDIFIVGSMTGEVLLVCSRCLGEFCYSVESAIDSMVQSWRGDFPQESELHRGELSVSFSEDGIVDTDAILCEQLFLEIPIQPLCSLDCRGLCPDCGALLRENVCSCADNVKIDPRLAVLKGLKVDKK
ncbi:MAG: DUF177 domain-containing protein [Thermodesulfobacteriota bacterium]